MPGQKLKVSCRCLWGEGTWSGTPAFCGLFAVLHPTPIPGSRG